MLFVASKYFVVEHGKCPEKAKQTKSLEYRKCLETGKTTKSLEYRRCPETAKNTKSLSFPYSKDFIVSPVSRLMLGQVPSELSAAGRSKA